MTLPSRTKWPRLSSHFRIWAIPCWYSVDAKDMSKLLNFTPWQVPTHTLEALQKLQVNLPGFQEGLSCSVLTMHPHIFSPLEAVRVWCLENADLLCTCSGSHALNQPGMFCHLLLLIVTNCRIKNTTVLFRIYFTFECNVTWFWYLTLLVVGLLKCFIKKKAILTL